jgi:hypothetical protein
VLPSNTFTVPVFVTTVDVPPIVVSRRTTTSPRLSTDAVSAHTPPAPTSVAIRAPVAFTSVPRLTASVALHNHSRAVCSIVPRFSNPSATVSVLEPARLSPRITIDEVLPVSGTPLIRLLPRSSSAPVSVNGALRVLENNSSVPSFTRVPVTSSVLELISSAVREVRSSGTRSARFTVALVSRSVAPSKECPDQCIETEHP